MLLPGELSFHVTRLPLQLGISFEERSHRFPSHFVDAIKSFGTLPADASVIAVTGPNFSLSEADEARIDADLRAAFPGPIVRSSQPIIEALEVLGCKTVTLVSPYEPWLTERARQFMERHGFEVDETVHMTEDFRPYEITLDEVALQIQALSDRSSDAIVFVANGVMTIPAFLSEAASTKALLLSSNLCAAWWLLRETGFQRGSDIFEEVAPRLAASLRDS